MWRFANSKWPIATLREWPIAKSRSPIATAMTDDAKQLMLSLVKAMHCRAENAGSGALQTRCAFGS
jgi:hypothetical protein